MYRPVTGPKPATALPNGAVDTQTHMFLPGFPAKPGALALPSDPLPGPAMYRQLMAWLGIDRMIITQGNAHQADNSNVLACLAEMGEAARGMGVILPGTPAAEMQRLTDGGIIGARIMDMGGAARLDALEALDALALDHGWVLSVQFDGSDILQQEDRLSKIRSKWVLDHHGKFFRGAAPDGPEIAAARRLVDGGRCWFKFAACYESSLTGGPDYADIAANARIMAQHAPNRILWGSNWPHNMARTEADYPDDGALLDTVLGWLTPQQRQLALVDNPEAFFGLPPYAPGDHRDNA